MMQFAEGDAVDIMYGESIGVSEEVKAEKRAELGLDQPFLIQYANWIKNLTVGDFGKSYISGRPVFETFLAKLPDTFLLMMCSIFFTLVIATPLGMICAVNQNGKLDYLIRGLTFVGNSMPNFFVALLLIYFLALKLNLFTVMANSNSVSGAILPALTLSIAMGAKYTRQIRAVVLEELKKPYVIGAKARGFGKIKILTNEILPCVLAFITTLVALSIGSLLGGATIVETVFMWDGVGKMAVDAILMRDYPVIEAYVLWTAVTYVFVNLAADILCYIIDPRIRYEAKYD
ncbi:MAG: ABC transporter permease [Selenomonadaceae bacterium]|nr:ABC transporter permease [Selenomonadaceae bacterium]